MSKMTIFKFVFALEVLNHLGRGLYRNFATVIAEAVSNSWDAEATEVRINIDSNAKKMTIQDNGKGMNADDFQHKFLKVGYSRRNDESNPSQRKVLGRKGIGKLALLSISDKVTIHSKKSGEEEIGGVIDNAQLDLKILEDGQYSLGNISPERFPNVKDSGTYMQFEGIKDSVNKPEIISKYLAVLFNFSFSFKNEKFDMYVNGTKVSPNSLRELHGNTQYLWRVGLNEELEKRFPNLGKKRAMEEVMLSHKNKQYNIKGYIASVLRPSHLRIHGAGGEFKTGVHLFANGRLRQENVFYDIATDILVERYLYGEIHVDAFDEAGIDDMFMSNREGIIKDSPVYNLFLDELAKIRKEIFNDWNKWRTEGKKAKIKEQVQGFDDLKPEKKKILDQFFGKPEEEQSEAAMEMVTSLIPQPSSHKILISHASVDKKYADIVYDRLIAIGLQPNEILYTSSSNSESRLPVNQDIFEHLRKFFVQEWRENPRVIFIVSPDMEKSWFSSLEAGAAWVTQTSHNLAVRNGHHPKPPLQINYIYMEFNENGSFKDMDDANAILKEIARTYKIASS